MSDSVTIYHNPRCSKSRATLAILEDKGVETEVVKYPEETPDKETLLAILNMLNMEPRDLMRKGEQEYKDNKLADETLTRDQLVDAMIAFPKLIERPIVVNNGKAAIGRPPESILDIL